MTSPSTSPFTSDATVQAPSAAAQRDLAALRQAVGEALDRKRRLGQYAVVWQEGRVRTLPPEALPPSPARPALATVLAAMEPLPEGLPLPEDLPVQQRDPL